jgi:hypothetical protein
MRITDNRMTIDLEDSDPRAVRIRAVLFDRPAASDPVKALWHACSPLHRNVLVAIAQSGEITQPDIERLLNVSAVELRGRHGGLARVAKRLGVEYPIVSVGGRRESRRFSLEPPIARQILRLNQLTNNQRNNT